MTDFLPIGDAVIELEKVEAILLDQAKSTGQPGKVHRVIFHVGESKYESRQIEIDPASPEGEALRRWRDGLCPALPFVPAPEGPVRIGPMCCREAREDMVRASVDFNPHVPTPNVRLRDEEGRAS